MKTLWLVLCSLLGMLFAGCGDKGKSSSQPPRTTAAPASGDVVLDFAYGSEKDAWLKAATAAFQSKQIRTASGARVMVKLFPMGSGDCVRLALDGTQKVDLLSPASEAFIRLANAERRTTANADLVEKTDALVLSPVVIAMWQPMAEALGWPDKPVGWKDILSLAKNPQGWSAYGHPEWGNFKFGHTHPEYSNSGLISALAMNYAALGKTHGLSVADIENPSTQKFVEEIEAAVIHYGESTGFFAKKMSENGPSYLSAAVLYESSVLEFQQPEIAKRLSFPIVAIYPSEGSFWSDHPVGIVNREWVTPEKKEAAKKYLEYLLSSEAQHLAANFGFRPSDTTIALPETFNRAHGVDAQEPRTTLEVPGAKEINAVLQSWKNNKKRSEIFLVIDVSGSMQDDGKLARAREAAEAFVNQLNEKDTFSLLAFNQQMHVLCEHQAVGTNRQQIVSKIRGLVEGGGTALYNAVDYAHQRLLESKDDVSRIRAVVVLTDGQDTDSTLKLPQLLQRISSTKERTGLRVFTIAYGKDADKKILSQIADSTAARSYSGNTDTIAAILKEISTFF